MFIAAVLGRFTSLDQDLDAQRAEYVKQHQERILRLWAPPPKESGLMFVVPPEGRMLRGLAEREVGVTWHGHNPVNLDLQAYTKPHYRGVKIDIPKTVQLEPGKTTYVRLRIKITELEHSVDTLDVYLNGEKTYAKL